MTRFRFLGFVQNSVSTNTAATKFQWNKIPVLKDEVLNNCHHHQENAGLRQNLLLYTPGLHSWCRGLIEVDVRLSNTGAFLNKRYFHATGSCQQNFYEVLGVPKDANQDDIRNAFQLLAKKCHPDTNKNNPAANRKFQEIREAFETLRDTGKRAQYDMKNTSSAGQGKYSDTNPKGHSAGTEGGFSSFHEERFSASIRSKFSKDSNVRRDGADIHVDANISFTQAIFGGKVVVPTKSGDVRIKIPKGIQPGYTVVMRSRGLRTLRDGYRQGLGDQYVHFCVKLPTLKPIFDILRNSDFGILFSAGLILFLLILFRKALGG